MANIVKTSRRSDSKILDSKKKIEDAFLRKTAKAIVSNITEATASKLLEMIDKNVYQAYTPKIYERSNDFLNCISIEKLKSVKGIKSVSSKVYLDPSKLHPKAVEGEWGKHMSMDGEPFTTSLIDVLENGLSSGPFLREGAHFLRDTMDWLQENGASEIVWMKDKIFKDANLDDVTAGVIFRRKK